MLYTAAIAIAAGESQQAVTIILADWEAITRHTGSNEKPDPTNLVNRKY